jgi:OOP family OmpA-OmpF porin
MRSSEATPGARRLGKAGVACLATLTVSVAGSSIARAQQQAQGFGVERLYLSAPDAGWFVMDTLDMKGGLGGVAGLTLGYAHDPLRIKSADGLQHLAVVSDQAFANFGFAATYDRWRFYLNFNMPLLLEGRSGTIGNYQFTAPCTPDATCTPDITPGHDPDLLTDVRIGFEGRLLGGATSPFRLGVDGQVFIPNGERAEYATDHTYRAMLRVLAAGDIGLFTYAGQLGVHVRPLDDSPTPGSPQGSELLFGGAAGARLLVSRGRDVAFVVGPELFGATAFQAFLGSTGTEIEGLLGARIEGTREDEPQLRVKWGVGGGIDPRFGAPQWRALVGIELFDHHADRDRDGVPNGRDACPDTPGIPTKNPRTNGCPPDRDGDGVPDRDDACSDQAAPPGTPNGCPGPDKDKP